VAITTADGILDDQPAWVIPKLAVRVKGHQAWATNVLAVHMPKLPYGMLLGMDFLEDNAASIDCRSRAVSFQSGMSWTPHLVSAPHTNTTPISFAQARRLSNNKQGQMVRVGHISQALIAEAKEAADAAEAPTAPTTPGQNPLPYVPSLPGDPTPHARQAAIDALLHKFRESTTQKDNLPHFADHPRVGALDGLALRINTEPDGLKRLRPRPPKRLSLGEGQELRRQLVSLLSRGFIRPSASPFAAPCFFVPKVGGAVRMVIDYRSLNQITIPDRVPPPMGQEQIDFLAGSRWISSIDLTAAYHHIPIAETDRHKTAFISECGQFEWTVCAFGLVGSPGIWNRLMLRLFGPFTQFASFARAFVDDLSVRSNGSFADHLSKVEAVLKELAANGLFANLSKCVIAATALRHLGQIVGRMGVQIDASRVAAFVDMPQPQTHAELRRFLGLATYLSRHIPRFSDICRPLNSIRNKRSDPSGRHTKLSDLWGETHQRAFAALRSAIASSPVLRAPDFAHPFYLQADSSKTSFGCALLQHHGDMLLPIAFVSRPLADAEVRWPIFDLEFGAFVFGTKAFRSYLLHSQCQWVVLSDHAPLTHWSTHGSSLTLRQIRQLDHLSQFDFR
jgi:hypothetical protein